MKEIKKILFPIDLSSSSPKIAPHVEMMRQKFDAEVHLLFVARAFSYFKGIYVPNVSVRTIEKELKEGGKRRIREFRNQYFPEDADVRTAVVTGDIPEEILSYIRTCQISLVIMGTHGRKGLEKAFFGSVADRVVKTSPVPVLVVNPHRV
ncbi:universal stress protein [Desulfonema ishimotonii]|uniref:Universal stress protein n=1 Tax=Desulfonema ishimotonii TaxID=45657 RepID=A0A401FQ65_9BACT|nr:universal stress protein [Desulfonema ishimotonii]GBC59134.1 universal stress protein [Desulfonema ishimotonii]